MLGQNPLPKDNCTIGFFDYNDLATQTTQLVHVGGVDTVLTNDGLGPQTVKTFKPIGISDVWDAIGGVFDFSELKAGDMVDIRLDLSVTTSAPNQEINVDLNLAQTGFDYNVHFDQAFFKTAAAHPINRFNGIYMADDNTLLNPGQFIFSSTDNALITVNGWYCKVLKRG